MPLVVEVIPAGPVVIKNGMLEAFKHVRLYKDKGDRVWAGENGLNISGQFRIIIEAGGNVAISIGVAKLKWTVF